MSTVKIISVIINNDRITLSFIMDDFYFYTGSGAKLSWPTFNVFESYIDNRPAATTNSEKDLALKYHLVLK